MVLLLPNTESWMPIVETTVRYDRPAGVGLRHFDKISVWFKVMLTNFRQMLFLRG